MGGALLLGRASVWDLLCRTGIERVLRVNTESKMWVGVGDRSVDCMLLVGLDMVDLYDAYFQRRVEERKGKPAASTTAQPPQQQR